MLYTERSLDWHLVPVVTCSHVVLINNAVRLLFYNNNSMPLNYGVSRRQVIGVFKKNLCPKILEN